jgi:hypothetical protein
LHSQAQSRCNQQQQQQQQQQRSPASAALTDGMATGWQLLDMTAVALLLLLLLLWIAA